MARRSILRDSDPDPDPTRPTSVRDVETRALFQVVGLLYVLPVVVGWLLSIMLVSWLIVVFGVSIWTVSIITGLVAAVATILTEEVVYDGQ